MIQSLGFNPLDYFYDEKADLTYEKEKKLLFPAYFTVS